jgi:hypothetical protein
MEPSDFLKHHFSMYSLQDSTPIDLRKTSFKKIGKFLEQMSIPKKSDGVIYYSEHKDIKGHKVITRIERDSLADFVP